MTFLELAQSFDRIEATSGRLEMTEILAGLFRAAKPSEARMIAYLIQGRVAPTFVSGRVAALTCTTPLAVLVA